MSAESIPQQAWPPQEYRFDGVASSPSRLLGETVDHATRLDDPHRDSELLVVTGSLAKLVNGRQYVRNMATLSDGERDRLARGDAARIAFAQKLLADIPGWSVVESSPQETEGQNG